MSRRAMFSAVLRLLRINHCLEAISSGILRHLICSKLDFLDGASSFLALSPCIACLNTRYDDVKLPNRSTGTCPGDLLSMKYCSPEADFVWQLIALICSRLLVIICKDWTWLVSVTSSLVLQPDKSHRYHRQQLYEARISSIAIMNLQDHGSKPDEETVTSMRPSTKPASVFTLSATERYLYPIYIATLCAIYGWTLVFSHYSRACGYDWLPMILDSILFSGCDIMCTIPVVCLVWLAVIMRGGNLHPKWVLLIGLLALPFARLIMKRMDMYDFFVHTCRQGTLP